VAEGGERWQPPLGSLDKADTSTPASALKIDKQTLKTLSLKIFEFNTQRHHR